MTSNEEHSAHLDATPTRQGRRGRHVMWILSLSTALAVVAVFGAWAWRSGDLASASGPAATAVAPAPTSAPRETPKAPPQTPYGY